MTNPTPQDREMAAKWAKKQGRHMQAANILRGSCDTAPLVQLFAAHGQAARLQGRREALEEAARVAEECPIDLPLAPGLSCGAVAASRQIAAAIRKLGEA